MNLDQGAAASEGDSGARPDGTLSGRWLVILRGAWVELALVEFVLFIAGIFAYAIQLQTVCTNTIHTTCNFWQPTPGNARALAHLGIPLGEYAAYFLTVDVLVSLVFWAMGMLIFWRKSDTGIGLFVSLVLVMFGAAGISTTLSTAFQTLYAPPVAVLLLILLTFIQFSALAAFLLTFPNGRFVPRWSWVVILLWILQDVFFQLPAPYNVSFWPLPLFAAELFLTWGTTLAIQVFRYVRVYDRGERQQVKWLLFGLAIVLTLNTLYRGVENLVPGFSNPDSLYQLADGTVTALLFVAIPLAIGVAILRHRLWDIDLIINRTLVYGTLTLSLALVYFGLVVVLQSLVGALTGTAGQQPLAIVASTLVIAALFQPLRRGIQSIIDRRFYRRKYDAARTLAAFSATLRDEMDLNQLSEQLVAVVQETMQPTHVSLWIRPVKWQASGGGSKGESASPVEERPDATGFDP
jgi:hypothetical protein